MVERSDEQQRRVIVEDMHDDTSSKSIPADAGAIDGSGIGREPNQLTTSETGVMSGGAGSEVGAVGDFDVAGQAGSQPVEVPGGESEFDPATGLSGQVSDTHSHSDACSRPEDAADDAHTGAAFPSDTP